MASKVQKVITLDHDEILSFCGEHDRKLKKIQSMLEARVIPRGNEIRLTGAQGDVDAAYRMVANLLKAQREGQAELSDRQLHHALDQGRNSDSGEVPRMLADTIDLPYRRHRLTPLTPTQSRYVHAIRDSDVTFCIGPAGTGKTYLAVGLAVESLLKGRVARMILVRPVVQAGESLGFLPGDIAQKIDPYVRPLYDALHEMLEAEKIHELIENGTIETAPLAFMRGRTLNNSFVILDEAQNTSIEQMKMFLTRMGFDSKVVVTGDITQIDLPHNRPSGLVNATKILKNVAGIKFIHFTRKDVVRHELVKKIVMAYETHAKK